MNAEYLNAVLYPGKPGRLFQPARLFLLSLGLFTLAACSAGRGLEKDTASPEKRRPARPLSAAKQATDSSDALFFDAVKARILNRKDEAFRKYSAFSAINPANASAHYELSRLWFEQNNLPRAMAEAKLALALDTGNKWILRQYGDLLSFDGRFVEAAEVFERLARRERAPEEYLMREVLLYSKAERYKEALSVLDRLSLLVGDDDETLIMQRQQLYLALNDAMSAAGEVRKLVKYYPAESRYLLLLAELYENNNIPDKAAETYREAERLFPDEASVQFSLIQYYLKMKDEARVAYFLEKAILNKEAGLEDRIGLLVPFIQYRGADSSSRRIAFSLSRKLAEQQPPEADAISLYGDLLLADGQAEKALEQYKQVIDLDSTKFPAWQQVMYIYTTRSQADSVIAYSERAIRIFPESSLAYYLGGMGYMQRGRNREAIDFLGKAIRFQTNSNDNLLSDMLSSLGDVYHTEKRFQSSDSCYEAAIALQPDNPTALNNYSYYLSERGEKLDQAAKMSEKSLKLRPDEATFLDTYGWILYKQGKYTESREYLKKAISAAKDQVDATLWEHLGDVEYQLGNAAEAVTNWKIALSKEPASEGLMQKVLEQKLNDAHAK